MGNLRLEKKSQGRDVVNRHESDPHRSSFGPLLNKDFKHKPPPVNGEGEGILGRSPFETRDDIGCELGDGEDHRCGDGTREDFPPLIQQSGSDPLSSSSSQLQPTNPRGVERVPESSKSTFQPQIDRFVGYFRRECRSKPRS
jgi:hypothetical protein